MSGCNPAVRRLALVSVMLAIVATSPGDASTCPFPDYVGIPSRLAEFGGGPSIVWTGDAFGVAWHDFYRAGNPEVYFGRFDSAGNPIGGDLRVSEGSSWSLEPSLVWTGSVFAIAWEDSRVDNYQIYFTRIDPTAGELDVDVRVTTDSPRARSPSLTWTGTEYGLAWYDVRDGNEEIYFTRLDAAGDKIGSDVRLTDDSVDSEGPSLVWNGSGYGVSWYDTPDEAAVHFARLDVAGNFVGEVLTFDGRIPSLVWTGSEYGLAFVSSRDGSSEIYFARIEASGQPIGSDVRVTDDPSYSRTPTLHWNGDEYAVVWSDERDGNEEIYFARIDALGNKLGADVRLTYDEAPSREPTIAWGDDGYGVSWRDPSAQLIRVACDCVDADADGTTVCHDCDDTDDRVFPGAPEACDGVNNDCDDPDWPAPPDMVDGDSDGFTPCDGECDDADDRVFPGAIELCDGLANDCDDPDWPEVPADEVDRDGDGILVCAGDCDDWNAAVGPGAEELCNQIDDDCDGFVDEDALGEDSDGDGLANACDHCPLLGYATQSDVDGDGQGDACDVDDGVIYIVLDEPGLVTWQEESGFASWNAYQGDLTWLRVDGAYTQDPVRVPLAATHCDLAVPWVAAGDPPAGSTLIFLVTGNDETTGEEGSLGPGPGGEERLNRFACP